MVGYTLAWQMSGLRPEKKPNRSWYAAGLHTIAHYMDMHRQTVANFIVNQLIWELCAGAVRRRGLPIQPFWLDQPMDLDLAKERGLLLPVQGTAGPAIIEEEDED
jgi:hypothetical protein